MFPCPTAAAAERLGTVEEAASAALALVPLRDATLELLRLVADALEIAPEFESAPALERRDPGSDAAARDGAVRLEIPVVGDRTPRVEEPPAALLEVRDGKLPRWMPTPRPVPATDASSWPVRFIDGPIVCREGTAEEDRTVSPAPGRQGATVEPPAPAPPPDPPAPAEGGMPRVAEPLRTLFPVEPGVGPGSLPSVRRDVVVDGLVLCMRPGPSSAVEDRPWSVPRVAGVPDLSDGDEDDDPIEGDLEGWSCPPERTDGLPLAVSRGRDGATVDGRR